METIENATLLAKISKEIEEKNRIKQIQELKRKLWCDVYVAYVCSSDSVTNNACYLADKAVKEFEERFNK